MSAFLLLRVHHDEPCFASIDSQLLLAFAGMPKLQLPKQPSGVLELRTYHSHSESKARRKIEMFNDGEITVFQKSGFDTVLFGESLYGPGLPHLTYLLAADDMESNKANWNTFINHPEWKAMKDLPKYADTVTNIEKVYLAPTAFSEV
ncbi:NIPSNAP family protein [Aeoliella mucimassa]|uniref:NIPSNAP family protein n=1 Tax=Aeoliella mucimassa TaxID=2527972 RepID=UPI0018D41591|nr:NIPSNAP family protein [Aeoliella mucimassa]